MKYRIRNANSGYYAEYQREDGAWIWFRFEETWEAAQAECGEHAKWAAISQLERDRWSTVVAKAG